MDARIKPDPSLNQLVHSSEIAWKPLGEPGISGIWIKPLRFDARAGRSPTFLLRFEPGAMYPIHTHPAGEEALVLEGDLRLGSDFLSEGDYLYTAPHNIHAAQSKNGCVALLNVPEAVVLLHPLKGA